jgi:hypothetical protein
MRWQARVKLLHEKKRAYQEKREQVLHRPPPTMDQRIAQQIRREQAAEAHASPPSESKCASSRLARPPQLPPPAPPTAALPLSHTPHPRVRTLQGGRRQAGARYTGQIPGHPPSGARRAARAERVVHRHEALGGCSRAQPTRTSVFLAGGFHVPAAGPGRVRRAPTLPCQGDGTPLPPRFSFACELYPS